VKRLYPFISAALFSGFMSCGEDKSGITLMPEIKNSDSAAVMFYTTPGNPRFFKYSKAKDIKLLQPFINDLGNKIIKEKTDCPTQGKIYFYGKGDAVEVVYFNGKEGCMILSFIVTGEKYYTKMSNASKELLDSLSKDAKEPAVQGQ
jgi:hypothetical protein